MTLNKKEIKNLIKAKNTLNKGFSEAALYTILDTYSKNISYENKTKIDSVRYPAFGEEKHIYCMKFPFEIESEAYINKNMVSFVSLWISNRHRCIFNQANTELVKRIYLYMQQLYNNRHR